ncbi:hypothetical protein [Rheinheimera sp. MM224]|uniref:hypothetical protein n=1 Tax=Rheinheimera sp. MM224 TaxID=3019969 RepID=UPI0021F8D9AE|nr:hypothetical protein [Rheinheimera sp. MM224]CAI3802156.1 hypothetical protein JAMGFMIE_03029 [Rheinheimera sp. MM224]
MKHMDDIFEVKSVAKTIAFCVFSFGLYVIYRLFTLTKQLNGNVEKPISPWFVVSAISVHLISLLGLILFFATNGSQELLLFSKLMHLVSAIFHVTWLIKIRNRINLISGVEKGSKYWLNPVMSSCLHVIYIQYKINQFLQINTVQQRVESNAM